jgi:hypothetical protein
LLVTVKKLNCKVEVEKVGKTDYLTIHLSDTVVKDADLEAFKGMPQIRRLYLQKVEIDHCRIAVRWHSCTHPTAFDERL